MSKTPLTGLRLLRENDVNNASSINYNLSRLDALSTLVLESISAAVEPTTPLLGQVWYVDPENVTQGSFWLAVQQKSLVIWTQDGEGIPAWQVVPVWDGAYAYDKSTEDFVTFFGSGWNVPSKNKVINVTLTQRAIQDYDGVSTDAANWYPLLRVESDHKVVQLHCLARLRASAMQAIGPAIDDLATYTLPYVVPKVAISQNRSVAPDPLNDEIIVEDYSETGGAGVWTTCRDVPTENLGSLYARQDLVPYSTGTVATFDVGKATEFQSGATSELEFYVAPGYPGYPTVATTRNKMVAFAWIYFDTIGERDIIVHEHPNPAVQQGWRLSLVLDPGGGGNYVLQWKYGRTTRWMYALPSDTPYTNATSNSLTSLASYVAPTSFANGLFTSAQQGQWIHVGVSYRQDTAPRFFINGVQCAGTKPFYGAGEYPATNSDLQVYPADMVLGDGQSGGMSLAKVKVYDGYAYSDNPNLAEIDYNEGTGTTQPENGREGNLVFQCDMDGSVRNSATSIARWWEDGEISTGTGINAGAVDGPQGAFVTFDELPTITATAQIPGYLLVNFEDIFSGSSSTGINDIADITVQVTYVG